MCAAQSLRVDWLPMVLCNNKFQAAHDHKEPDQKFKDLLIDMPHNERRDYGAQHGEEHKASAEPHGCEVDNLQIDHKRHFEKINQ